MYQIGEYQLGRMQMEQFHSGVDNTPPGGVRVLPKAAVNWADGKWHAGPAPKAPAGWRAETRRRVVTGGTRTNPTPVTVVESRWARVIVLPHGAIKPGTVTPPPPVFTNVAVPPSALVPAVAPTYEEAAASPVVENAIDPVPTSPALDAQAQEAGGGIPLWAWGAAIAGGLYWYSKRK